MFDEEYENLEDGLLSYLSESGHTDIPMSVDSQFSDFDDSVSEFDFSSLQGDFKKSFSKVNRRMSAKRSTTPRTSRNSRLTKEFAVKKRAVLQGKSPKKMAKVIVPKDRPVIVEGVSKFILSQSAKDNAIRQIGYYRGEKLQEMVLIFNNNNSAVDFQVEIFNPSMPLDYLYSTSQNINNKVQVAGGSTQYTDVLYNILANPTLIPNCKFVFDGPQLAKQVSIPLEIKNKNSAGVLKVDPLNLALKFDTMQVANNIVFFDMHESLNRPFIPDGMDVIKYTVLAGMTVTMAFFYKQVSLKKVFYQEARNSKKLL
jgi:hypothetical protein